MRTRAGDQFSLIFTVMMVVTGVVAIFISMAGELSEVTWLISFTVSLVASSVCWFHRFNMVSPPYIASFIAQISFIWPVLYLSIKGQPIYGADDALIIFSVGYLSFLIGYSLILKNSSVLAVYPRRVNYNFYKKKLLF